MPFWEIAPENVIGDGGRDHDPLCRILARDPVISHGLGLSVGGFDPRQWLERGVQSAFYRDLSATFLGWLAATGWGQDRWPFLLPLAHFELLMTLVARHPGGELPAGLRPAPRLGDRLVLEPPTQVVSYPCQVHLCTEQEPVPAPGPVHLLAYRDRQGTPQWLELTPATAALLLGAQREGIGQTALELGLADLSEAVELLADLRTRGALAGFR